MSQEEYRRALGLADNGELVQDVADMWRWWTWRLGLCSQGHVSRQLRRRLSAAGVPEAEAEQATAESLEAVLEVGDISRVRIASGVSLAPNNPHLLPLADDVCALVGGLPSRLCPAQPLYHSSNSVVRWLPREPSTLSALQSEGVTERSLEAWIGIPRLLTRSWHSGERGPATLAAAWRALEQELMEGANLAARPDQLVVVNGAPGARFGSPGERGRGRWGPPTEAGAWIGRRPGHGPGHMHPVLVIVGEDGQVRMADLHDQEDATWALIARGAAVGRREVVQLSRAGKSLLANCSFPPPRQVRRLLSICGARAGSWSWAIIEAVHPTIKRALARLDIECKDTTGT